MSLHIRWDKEKMGKRIFTALVISSFSLAVILGPLNVTKSPAAESVLGLDREWTGDFDKMVERHLIRVLVPYSKTFYFLDRGHQRGLIYETLKEFEKYLNNQLGKKTLKVRVMVIPTKRDRLLPALLEGIGDIAAGNLTITPERQKLVDFSEPGYTGVDEIVVSGPTSPPVKTIDDLSGKEIHVRRSSSYYESLKRLDGRLRKEGKKGLKIVPADEYLEDEDLLEMINAGLIPMSVIDSHKGRFWSQVFKNLTLYQDVKVRTGGRIGWAIRKGSPNLEKVVNDFIKTRKKGTLVGNILFKRYLENTKWVRNSLNNEELKRFSKTVKLFQIYADQYNFDWVMIAALAYQESRIDQSKRSPAGAIGVMQVLPSTARDKNVNIPDIEGLENNIHAGVKYLRFIRDRYFEKEPMDDLNKILFSFASYNAGPAKVARLRNEASRAGLDPNDWFRNVENIAARRIGRETVQYVGNIYKYYIAYKLIVDKYYEKEEVKKVYKGSH